jgi:hypothetical protein
VKLDELEDEQGVILLGFHSKEKALRCIEIKQKVFQFLWLLLGSHQLLLPRTHVVAFEGDKGEKRSHGKSPSRSSFSALSLSLQPSNAILLHFFVPKLHPLRAPRWPKEERSGEKLTLLSDCVVWGQGLVEIPFKGSQVLLVNFHDEMGISRVG